jgi:hypothetical protein
MVLMFYVISIFVIIDLQALFSYVMCGLSVIYSLIKSYFPSYSCFFFIIVKAKRNEQTSHCRHIFILRCKKFC